jgi:hypothetical protein
MDVDHAGKPIMTIGTGDASVIVGTLTDLIINDIGGIAANGDLTGTVTGEIAIGTWPAVEPGVAAAARVRTRSCTAL